MIITKSKMDPKVHDELLKCDTVKQMFEVLAKYYVLENSRPGIMVKGMIVTGLKSAIAMLKPEVRK